MHLSPKRRQNDAFTLAEVAVAVAVVALFGLGAFATNERLLLAVRSQRESTAASMMLQERMEAFRSLLYSGIASYTQSGTPPVLPPSTAADIVANTTTSEAQLGGITGSLLETITVSGYMDTSGNIPASPNKNVWVRNSTNPTGNLTSSNSTLASTYDLIQVDIQLSWTGANGRSRKREVSAIFGKGNG